MSPIFVQFIQKPNAIFLVDGLGAFATASILFPVQWQFQEYFGMPQEILSVLCMIAVAFAVYSFCCFLFLKKNWIVLLKVIMTANLLYCCLTIGLVIHYYSTLSIVGLTYFLAEIAVIVGLVYIEIQTLKMGIQKLR
ncbi:MAG: hypothetical protein IM574_00810 [Cytophagales bacterium]|jgi:hypothetical protein|nr:hypothetical protein [Cytophagales bacterium]MCA6387200.1 hypothetical protein [Cytophagales bacterium]MCA6392954.1 hypothetical protein [Cytophagales bacterium]MCA6396536.1 hypothetical protein [Cytophagales bacterium]MCA6398687.1 hypothetical protein [Cytophagales bacterium]